MKKISLVKYAKRRKNLNKVLDLISKDINLYNKKNILIKVSLQGYREIYANTNIEAVEILIDYLKKFPSIEKIYIAEGSKGFYYTRSTSDIFKRFKYNNLLNKPNISLIDLDEVEHNEKIKISLIGGAEDNIRIAKPEYDYMISLVPPKTHDFCIVALNIVNMIGFIHPEDKIKIYGLTYENGNKRSLYSMPRYVEAIKVANKNIAKLASKVNPDLSIIEGLYGMEGKGPLKGSPVFHGFAIASTDFVKADALGTYVMGFHPKEIGYITHARSMKLGSTNFKSVIGEKINYVKFPYRAHPFYENQKKWKAKKGRDNKNE